MKFVVEVFSEWWEIDWLKAK